jgi:Skp family chaperone for outer membrane proteins
VKRTITILAAVATLGVGFYVGSHVWAQQTNPQQSRPQVPPLQTRVAVINVAQVIKNYNKFKMYQDELKRLVKPLNEQVEKLKADAAAKRAQAAKPETTAQQRELLERDVKTLERQIQDLVDEANKNFSKKSMDQLQTIYRDVQNAATVYARANGFEMVLQYNDGADPTEQYGPASLQQKLSNQACFPLYKDDRMDLTGVVTEMLNRQYTSTPATPTTGQPAPATGGQAVTPAGGVHR